MKASTLTAKRGSAKTLAFGYLDKNGTPIAETIFASKKKAQDFVSSTNFKPQSDVTPLIVSIAA